MGFKVTEDEITQGETVNRLCTWSASFDMVIICEYDLWQGQYLKGLLYLALGINEIGAPMLLQ